MYQKIIEKGLGSKQLPLPSGLQPEAPNLMCMQNHQKMNIGVRKKTEAYPLMACSHAGIYATVKQKSFRVTTSGQMGPNKQQALSSLQFTARIRRISLKVGT